MPRLEAVVLVDQDPAIPELVCKPEDGAKQEKMALVIAAQKDKTPEEKGKEVKEQGINVVVGQRPLDEIPVIDKQSPEESGTTGTGKGGKGRSGQENYEDVGGAAEAPGSMEDTNFFI